MKMLLPAIAIVLAPMALAGAQASEPPKSKADQKTMRLYKGQNFTGENYVVDRARPALQLEMNVGSIAIFPGEKWEVCDKPRFKGNCTIVEADTANMGAVAIQSARPVKAPKPE